METIAPPPPPRTPVILIITLLILNLLLLNTATFTKLYHIIDNQSRFVGYFTDLNLNFTHTISMQ